MKHPLLIIGSGPAGLTAGIYAARAELSPIIFEGRSPGGQLMGTTEIENFPGFSKGIMGPELIHQMREQAKRFGADVRMETVESVDFSDPDNLKVTTNKETYQASSVILATGASARWLDLGKGEEKYWGRGYTACATCDGAFFKDKVVAVVGGGDSACEEAHFLTRFASKVYMILRRDEFRASKPMEKRVKEHEKIEIIYNKSVTGLSGDPLLQSIELTDTRTAPPVKGDESQSDSGSLVSTLKVDGLFMAIGHNPNTEIFADFIERQPNKYFTVHEEVKSNIPSVFIAGDCSDWRYRQAITAAGFGCMAALEAERFLSEKEN